MNRWTRIAVVVFSWGAIVSLPSVVVLAEEADTRPPNIVLILADDLGYGGIGVQGSGDIPTPHIDSLARSGVRCTQAYMSWPACNPSRAALMTGRYHERFGFEVNPADATVAPPDYGIPRDVPTMAELGYPGVTSSIWTGLYTKAGTPQPAIDRLNSELVKIINSPAFKDKFEALGFVVKSSTPQELAAFTDAETKRWGNIIKTLGIKPQ